MAADNTKPQFWSPRAKAIVSVVVVLQLLAVVAEPLHFFSISPGRGSSYAFRPLRSWLRPYVEFTYLNHGYFFFAPEPGPSHLIQCSLEMPEGKTVSLRYPDKQTQTPRLVYHRHFMLTEFLNQLHVPPVDSDAVRTLGEEEARDWSRRRQTYEAVRESFEHHLAKRFGASKVSIERVRHILPGTDVVLDQRLPLNDPSLYITLPDVDPPTVPATATPLIPLGRPRTGESVEVQGE